MIKDLRTARFAILLAIMCCYISFHTHYNIITQFGLNDIDEEKLMIDYITQQTRISDGEHEEGSQLDFLVIGFPKCGRLFS